MYSVVIPVYNVNPDFLKQCLDSILVEKRIPIQIVLVDDKSTNGCEMLCDEYSNKDHRVKTIHNKKNLGVSEARNIGINESQGEWIIFIDSDDWVEHTTFESIATRIVNSEYIDIVIFSAYRESLSSSAPFGTTFEIIAYNNINNNLFELRDKLLKQSLMDTHPRYETIKYCWGKVFRRSFLIENNLFFPELNYCEDIVFMNRAFQKAKNVIQIPERLYHYRVNANSVVHSFRFDAMVEQRRFIELMEETESGESETLYYAALLSMQICITRYFFNKKNKKNILKKHREAVAFFQNKPYPDVFCHVKYKEMKKNEKYKAILIKNKLYYLYYLATRIKNSKTVNYQ